MSVANKRIAVLGGRGMLGTEVVNICRSMGLEADSLDLPEFDITDSGQLQEVVRRNGIIINCAAYTNVDRAESEQKTAFSVNADAVGLLGRFCKEAGRWVLHISTDFVFDGRGDRPYVETDMPNPINAYGKSKLAGERLLSESGCRFCIIRVEWTYGTYGNNFVKKLIDAAKAGKTLKVVDDQVGSPTATAEVAQAIGELLKKPLELPEGLFHLAADGFVSRYEVARFVFDRLGMNAELHPCRTSDFVSAAARPLNSRFNCGRIKALLGVSAKPWQEPLQEFLERL